MIYLLNVIKNIKNKDHKKIIILTLISIITNLIDIISLGFLIAVITIISNQQKFYEFLTKIEKIDLFNKGEIFNKIYNLESKLLVLIILISFLLLSFFKLLFNFYTNYLRNFYIHHYDINLKKKLLEIFFNTPYKLYKDISSTNQIFNLTSYASQYKNVIFVFPSQLLNELILILFVVLTIALIRPNEILIITICLSILAFAYINFFKKKIYTKSQKALLIELNINKSLKDNFFSFKEITIYNLKNYLINNFLNLQEKLKNINIFRNSLLELPKNLFEFFGFCILCGITIYMIIRNIALDEIFITLVFFTIALLKILPSINKIISLSQSYKEQKESIKIINENLLLENQYRIYNFNQNNKNEQLQFQKYILVKKLYFKYENFSKSYLLHNINFKINKNSSFGIYGESGSGKSTLIDLILGLLNPSQGQILLDKTNINKNIKNWQRMIGYVSQKNYMIEDSIKNNIIFGQEYRKNELEKILEELNLHKFLKIGINKNIGENGIKISGGELQRIAIARALYRNSEIMIFDEHTSNLDEKNEKHVMNFCKKLKNKTLIFVSHKKSVLNFCDNIFKIN